MRTAAQKPKAAPQSKPAESAKANSTLSGECRYTQSILRLQRRIGNQALGSLLSTDSKKLEMEPGADVSTPFVQPKLIVNASGDIYEQEADRIAEQVMSIPETQLQPGGEQSAAPATVRESIGSPGQSARLIQLKCGECQNEDEKLQRKTSDNTATPRENAASAVGDLLNSPGESLDPATRQFFEPRFGRDFSQVRIHTGFQAAESARDLNALAYTVGRDIVFGGPQYPPHSINDQRLLAHELAHVVQQQNTGPMIQRCPRGQTLDRSYHLCRSQEGTTMNFATTDYGLSEFDREHLRRWQGFYFIQTSTTSLITPPEVRRAAGRRPHSVLIPFSSADLAQFPRDPEGTVRRLVTSTLGIRVGRMTRSTEPDQRFATSALPQAVEEALTTGTEEGRTARERAAATTQAHTLSDAARRGETLPMQPLTRADQMSPGTVGGMTSQGRADWYVSRLGHLQTQIYESARRHNIPMQLLAVVILNELADINIVDVIQSGPRGFGSLGIAQIQVSTAQRDRLVDPQGSRSVADLLQVPQVGVEAAAREIGILLGRMSAHRSSLFQQQHAFTARHGAEGNAIYNEIGGETREIREANLARMVCAAYNSPDIIVTRDLRRYRNAIIHGDHARSRAFDLYRFGLFRDAAPRTERRERAASLAVQQITGMRFDGSTLIVTGGTETRYTSLSGLRPTNPHNHDGRDHTGPSSQGLPDVGPIIEGSYTLVPTEIERGGFDTGVWGPVRVRLHEGTLTGIYRRLFTARAGGFFLHQDVRNDGTAGCIGLQTSAATRELFARIARTESTIPIEVRLTNPPRPMPAEAPRPHPHNAPTHRRRRRRRHRT